MALIEIDEKSDFPVWVQIRKRLIFLISSGHFRPGDRLPTVRGLAADISVNYNTVNKAYLSLISDGYLESMRGSGVYVRDLDVEMGEEYAQELEEIMDDFIQACCELGLSMDDIKKCLNLKIRQRELAQCASQRKGADNVARIIPMTPDSPNGLSMANRA